VPDFYDFDQANAKLPEIRELVLRLQEQRDEIVAVRNRIVELNAPLLAGGAAGGAAGAISAPGPVPAEAVEETQRLRMKMQGLVDQMQAGALQLDGWGIQLREIATGLVDFPALVSGRPVWLCWRLGEERVEWWHETSEGFEARRRIEDLY
jgi:hypothetical protein